MISLRSAQPRYLPAMILINLANATNDLPLGVASEGKRRKTVVARGEQAINFARRCYCGINKISIESKARSRRNQ